MKIVEKKLPIGRFRVTIQSAGEMTGHTIESVALKGQRNRPWPLRKATAEEFYERHPADLNGNPADTAIPLRGMPIMWFQRGTIIYLWPAPNQDWTLQVTLRPKHADALSQG